MGKLKNTETGFSTTEAILIIILAGIVGFTGWYVWHATRTANKTLTSDNSTVPTFNNKKSVSNSTDTQGASETLVSYDCYKYSVKPASIRLTCADAGISAQNIQWNSWAMQTATGSGEIHANDCLPDCASGHFHDFPAKFVLNNLKTVGQKKYFTQLHVTYTTAATVPNSNGNNYSLSYPLQ